MRGARSNAISTAARADVLHTVYSARSCLVQLPSDSTLMLRLSNNGAAVTDEAHSALHLRSVASGSRLHCVGLAATPSRQLRVLTYRTRSTVHAVA